MRLKEPQVKLICQKILDALRGKQLMHLKKNEGECLNKLIEIFVKELKVEDEINREAERLLEQYTRSAGTTIDREKMFQMIKKQLVKDKGAII